MQVYFKNIKSILKINKSGRWQGNINVYKYILKYTIKYIIKQTK